VKHNRMSTSILVAVLMLWSAPALPAAAGGGLGRVEAFVNAEMKRQRVPGVAVAVVRDGKVIMTRGFGLANVELGVPVRPETIFQSGSLGKMFAAALVMTLVEEGKMSLSDPITRYLPDAPQEWSTITIRNLLTHTSGIPDYTDKEIDLRRDYSEDEFARVAFGLKLEFETGSRWNYSNTGYALLGIIVHKASGVFYGDLMRQRIFEPLGMKTARVISEADIVPNRAAGYRLVDGELKNQEWVAPTLNTMADGSLYFSILDLVAWDRGLRQGAILKPDSWARVFEPVRLNSGRTYPYGFGWDVEDIDGHAVQQHGGSWQGFRTHLTRYTKEGLTIAVLTNLAEAEPDRFVEGIAGIVEPSLARRPPQPIPDRDPAVTAGLKQLLEQAATGTLPPARFTLMRAGFFPETAAEYEKLLRNLGAPVRIDLLGRKELGDDRIFTYRVGYAKARLAVVLGLAPDGRISEFDLSPEPPETR
jgi:CubicO group peptidase (beta-lactamase class C family)